LTVREKGSRFVVIFVVINVRANSMASIYSRVVLARALLVGCVAVGATQLLGAPPTLQYSTPAGAAHGQSVDVTLHGANLEGVTATWSSFGATIVVAKSEGGSAMCKVTIPANARPGVGALRVATKDGVSNPLLFLIDDLGVVAGKTEAMSREAAQPITVPTAVDGACSPARSDFYSFEVESGSKLSFEVFAGRLGSPLDPVLRLLDGDGKELAFSDDEPGLGADCRFSYGFETAGRYWIELRDVSYRGGADRRYRLRVGDFPLVTSPYPLGVQVGSVTPLTFVGPDVGDVEALSLVLPAGVPESTVALGVQRKSEGPLGFVRLAAGNLPEAFDLEPNDDAEGATQVTAPLAINGRFDKPKDRDCYAFQMSKGQRLRFVGLTRSLGAPTDLFLRLLGSDGKELARVDDSGDEEGVIDHTFGEEGTYVLLVEDLHFRGGPELTYRIEVRPFNQFSLAVDAERVSVPHGGVLAFRVKCDRQGYGGPVALRLKGLGKLGDQTFELGAGKSEIQMTVVLPRDLERGRLMPLTLEGTAIAADPPITVLATSTKPLRALHPRQEYPPPGLDKHIAVGIGAPFPDFFKIAVEADEVLFARGVGLATVKVTCERVDAKFKEAIPLSVDGLPEGFSVQLATDKKDEKPAAAIAKDKVEADVVIKGPANVKLGTQYSLTIRGQGTYQNQPKEFVVAGVPFRVVAPLRLTVSPVGAVPAGGKQKVKVSVERFGDTKAPVVLTWKGLPVGVSGPEEAEIPADKSELEVEFSAGDEVTSGRFRGVQAVGKMKLGDAVVGAESAPFVLELKSP